MKILIINGPNINMLGIREPDIYGSRSYEDLIEFIKKGAEPSDELIFVQSNHEGDIIDYIQRAYFENFDGIIINPAAYTHTSIAIADALKAIKVPAVEVHISDIKARESYRSKSIVEDATVATITGKGFDGYIEALNILHELD